MSTVHRDGYTETAPEIGEPLPDYMPRRALAQVDAVLRFGARKHSPRGFATDSRTIGHHLTKALGHATDFVRGVRSDPETGYHPLAHAAARLLCALERSMEGLP